MPLAGTVGTCLDHPSKGKTQLFRRNQTLQDVYRILKCPRVHTGTDRVKATLPGGKG